MTTTTLNVENSPNVSNEEYARNVAMAGTLYQGLRSQELLLPKVIGEEYYIKHAEAIILLTQIFGVSEREIMNYSPPRRSSRCPLTHNVTRGAGLTGKLDAGEGSHV